MLAVRPGALGDTLLTFPALALLRRRWPAARLTLVARRDVLPLARASGLADDAHPYDDPAWAALFSGYPPADGLVARLCAEAEAAVAWLPDPDGAIAHTLARLGARRVSVAPGRPAPDAHEHTARLLARALVPLEIAPPDSSASLAALVPPLSPPAADLARTEALWTALELSTGAAPVLALHAGSGGAAKRWPPAAFARLAALATTHGFRPLLLAGPQDAEVTRAVLAALPPDLPPPPVVAEPAIGTLAALLARCAAFVGNDAGVAHLAGLLGIPTLALFGPTDPTIWAPLGPRVGTLRAPDGELAGLAPTVVWHALRALLP
ncbi:MAG TPA: glycosyltransferase family 9 protein [Ktedonobacterales bacterium]